MIIKLSYDKLKEIMNKEKRVDLYLDIGFEDLFDLVKYKGLLINSDFESSNSKVTSSYWVVKKDVHAKEPNHYENQLKLYVRFALRAYKQYKEQLKDFEHFGMTEVEMEVDVDLISHFKTIEECFIEFDKYFLDNIGDIEKLDIQKIITAGKELEELEMSN